MSIKEELKKSLVSAAKARDQVLLDTVRAVQSAIRYKEIEKKSELSDAEIVSVVSTLCKQRRESIDQFTKGGRSELAEKETRELAILETYLPAQLSVEEVRSVIQKIIVDSGAQGDKDFGVVMKLAMKALAGQADGRVVGEVVKSLLKS